MNKCIKNLMSMTLAFLVAFSGQVEAPVYAQSSSQINVFQNRLAQDATAIRIPKEIGEVEEIYRGQENRFIVLVQDAHAIPDAQNSIRGILNFFREKYEVDLAFVEGSSTELNPQFFRSFPDPKLLKKVFKQYLHAGELTGATAAALFNEKSSHFVGIENWDLYEEEIGFFLKAITKENESLQQLNQYFHELNEIKEKHYSKELLEVDRAITSFRQNKSDLAKLIETLAQFKEPLAESRIEALWSTLSQSESVVSLEIEVKSLATRVRKALLRMSATPGLYHDQEIFNLEYQKYRTSKSTAETFSLILKKIIEKYQMPLEISSHLDQRARFQKRIQDIKGTQIFNELESYITSVKKKLFENPLQFQLDKETKYLELIEDLIKLELSQNQWIELVSMQKDFDSWIEKPTEGIKYQSVHRLLKDLETNIRFYEIARQRDAVFAEKALLEMTRRNRKQAVLVAGGFHTEGLMSALKSKGISYALVTPKIQSMPEENHYRGNMKGDVSWQEYFEIKNGKVNLYKAFARGTRDLLLKESKEDQGILLKKWRDQIIRDLASQGQIEEASQYLALIDEVAGKDNQESQLKNKWLSSIDDFMDRVGILQREGHLNEQNVLKLIQPATAAEAVLANAFSRNELRVELLPTITGQFLEADNLRSELRSEENETASPLEAGRRRVQELVERDGYVAFQRKSASDLFQQQNPSWLKFEVGSETRFYPPSGEVALPVENVESAKDRSPEELLKELAHNWDLQNRMARADEWFEGGKVNEAARKGFDEALVEGGQTMAAHGMSKESTLSGGIKNLLNLLRNGLDMNRRGGQLDTAPLVARAGEGLVGATASGSAYADGPFILVQNANAQKLSGNLEGLGAILVNQAHPEIVDALRIIVQQIRPDIIVDSYANAGKVTAELKNRSELRSEDYEAATSPEAIARALEGAAEKYRETNEQLDADEALMEALEYLGGQLNFTEEKDLLSEKINQDIYQAFENTKNKTDDEIALLLIEKIQNILIENRLEDNLSSDRYYIGTERGQFQKKTSKDIPKVGEILEVEVAAGKGRGMDRAGMMAGQGFLFQPGRMLGYDNSRYEGTAADAFIFEIIDEKGVVKPDEEGVPFIPIGTRMQAIAQRKVTLTQEGETKSVNLLTLKILDEESSSQTLEESIDDLPKVEELGEEAATVDAEGKSPDTTRSELRAQNIENMPVQQLLETFDFKDHEAYSLKYKMMGDELEGPIDLNSPTGEKTMFYRTGILNTRRQGELPQTGLEFLVEELFQRKKGSTLEEEMLVVDLLYSTDGRLLGVFPAFTEENQKLLSLNIVENLAYFDLSPYYFEVPTVGDETASEKWQTFSKQLDQDRQTIESFLKRQNEDRGIETNAPVFSKAYNQSNKSHAPYLYVEVNQNNGEVSTVQGFFPNEYDDYRYNRKRAGYHQIILPIFPSVYSPGVDFNLASDLAYYNGIGSEMNLTSEDDVLVAFAGSGMDALLAYYAMSKNLENSQASEIVLDLIDANPLAIANEKAIAQAAGFNVRAVVNDNVFKENSDLVFGQKKYDRVFANMPYVKAGVETAHETLRVQGLHDGDRGKTLNQFAEGLLQLLKPDTGRARIWNSALYERNVESGKMENTIAIVLQTGGGVLPRNESPMQVSSKVGRSTSSQGGFVYGIYDVRIKSGKEIENFRSELREELTPEDFLNMALSIANEFLSEELQGLITVEMKSSAETTARHVVASTKSLGVAETKSRLKEAVVMSFLASRQNATFIWTEETLETLRQESQFLISSLEKLEDRSYSIAVSLPDQANVTNEVLFRKLLEANSSQQQSLSELVTNGALPVVLRNQFAGQDARSRSVSNFRRSFMPFNDQVAVPLLMLGKVVGNINEMFIPFEKDLSDERGVNIEDPMMIDYVELLRSVVALHMADLSSLEPTLLQPANSELLKAALISRLNRFGENFENIISKDEKGWTIKGSVAKAYLEMQIAQITASSA